MRFLSATEDPTGLQFTVCLDTSQASDPAYVRSYAFGPAPADWTGASLNGAAYTTWAAYCTAEVKLLAQADLAAMQPPAPAPTPLAVSGTTF